MAISYVNSWTGQGSGTPTSLAISTSSGTQAQVGDVLVAYLENYKPGGNAVFFAPAGWTASVPTFTGQLSAAVFYKVVASGDIGASFTFTNGGHSNQWSGNISAWRGADNVTPIDAAGTGSTGGQSSSIDAASITLAKSGDTLLWFASTLFNPVTLPTGYSSIFNYAGSSGNYQASAGGYKTGLSSGATGTISGSVTSDWWVTVTVALASAVAGQPTIPATRRRKRPVTTKLNAGKRNRSNIQLARVPAPFANFPSQIRRKPQPRRTPR